MDEQQKEPIAEELSAADLEQISGGVTPGASTTTAASSVKTSDKHQKAVLDFVKG